MHCKLNTFLSVHRNDNPWLVCLIIFDKNKIAIRYWYTKWNYQKFMSTNDKRENKLCDSMTKIITKHFQKHFKNVFWR